MLLAKLKHYSVRGLTHDWFRSSLSNRKQIVSINDHYSNLPCVLYGVPYSSVLGPLFLIYMNDLNHAIKLCKVHHFTEDTNLLHFSQSITTLNKYVNLNVKDLTGWSNANKISLNVQKTEFIISKYQRKKKDSEVKIKLSKKQLYTTGSVKYLGIRIDENVNWEHHVNDIRPF